MKLEAALEVLSFASEGLLSGLRALETVRADGVRVLLLRREML